MAFRQRAVDATTKRWRDALALVRPVQRQERRLGAGHERLERRVRGDRLGTADVAVERVDRRGPLVVGVLDDVVVGVLPPSSQTSQPLGRFSCGSVTPGGSEVQSPPVHLVPPSVARRVPSVLRNPSWCKPSVHGRDDKNCGDREDVITSPPGPHLHRFLTARSRCEVESQLLMPSCMVQ